MCEDCSDAERTATDAKANPGKGRPLINAGSGAGENGIKKGIRTESKIMTGSRKGATTMTENEAIEKIKDLSDMGFQSYRDAKKMAISALKEVQQYREIGTVEECREAMRK